MDKAPHHRPAQTFGQVIQIDRARDRLPGRRPSPLPTVEFGSGWYHDAAIAEVAPAAPKVALKLVQ